MTIGCLRIRTGRFNSRASEPLIDLHERGTNACVTIRVSLFYMLLPLHYLPHYEV